MKTPFLYLFLLLLVAITFWGCKKNENQLDKDIDSITKHLNENNIQAQRFGDLFIYFEQEGSGEFPNENSEVKVHYRGTLLNGTEFDSSFRRGEPLEIRLTQVIEGWRKGIPKFKRGGKGKIFIPSELGYGTRAQGSIPANSVLIFEIELIDFR